MYYGVIQQLIKQDLRQWLLYVAARLDHNPRLISNPLTMYSIQLAASSSSQQIPLTSTLNMISKDHRLSQNYVGVQNTGPIWQDRYTLYKTKAVAEMEEPQRPGKQSTAKCLEGSVL